MDSVLIFILTALIVVGFFVGVTAYARLKNIANGLLALGVKEFHDAADSLMQTPEELPDGVLNTLAMMNRTAFDPKSHWKLRDLIRGKRQGVNGKRRDDAAWEKEINSMRPELQHLLARASVAWLNIMCNRSILVGTLIGLELRKMEIKAGRLSPMDGEAEAIKVLPGLCGTA